MELDNLEVLLVKRGATHVVFKAIGGMWSVRAERETTHGDWYCTTRILAVSSRLTLVNTRLRGDSILQLSRIKPYFANPSTRSILCVEIYSPCCC